MADKVTSKRWLIPVVVVVLVAAAGIWLVRGSLPSRPGIEHVILISLDTVRQDYVSCYGFDMETTPNIDALSAEGYRFSHAISPIPLTLPAHTSMLTGMIPPHHGKRDNMQPYFDPSIVTLASLLKSAGFNTGGFISAQVMNSQFGLDRGFDEYQDQFDNPNDKKRRGEEVNRVAFEWLDRQGDDSVFMFLHYYDPHAYYTPPEPFASRFPRHRFGPDEVLHDAHLYAGEIAYADHCIGDVIDELKRRDMYDSSLIIVTADHGEMLGEHGEGTHQYFIYQSALKVPLVFKLPGEDTGGKVIDDMAGIIDIVPTVCELLDVEPPEGIEGQSMAGHFLGNPPPPEDRYLYCESLRATSYGANGLTGLVGRDWKYIFTTRPELYDLQEDPDELHNLVGEQPRMAEILKENLTQVGEMAAARSADPEEIPIGSELVSHLRSLGYVGEITAEEDTVFDEQRDDPKDLIDLHNAWREGSHHFISGKHKEALAAIEEALQRRPVYVLCELATQANMGIQDYEKAMKYAQMATEERPGDYRSHELLAFASSFAGEDQQASEHFELAVQLIPDDIPDFQSRSARLNFQLGMTRVRQERSDLAIEPLEQALNFSSDEFGGLQQHQVANALARALLDSPPPNQDPARALQMANQACSLTNMQYPPYLGTKARAHTELKQFEQATQVARQALSMAQAAGDADLEAEMQGQLDLIRQRANPF